MGERSCWVLVLGAVLFFVRLAHTQQPPGQVAETDRPAAPDLL